jgi:hypothetical protein
MAVLQASFMWLIPPAAGLRFLDRPALVELHNLDKKIDVKSRWQAGPLNLT